MRATSARPDTGIVVGSSMVKQYRAIALKQFTISRHASLCGG